MMVNNLILKKKLVYIIILKDFKYYIIINNNGVKTMGRKKILFGSIFVLALILLMPSIPAVQQKTIEDRIKHNLQEKLNLNNLEEMNDVKGLIEVIHNKEDLPDNFPIGFLAILIMLILSVIGLFFAILVVIAFIMMFYS